MEREFSFCPLNKHIVIAVDDSGNAQRAVSYVSYLLAGVSGFSITLLNIILLPPEDFFTSDDERLRWIENEKIKAEQMLKRYRQMLVGSEFSETAITTRAEIGDLPTVAECIFKIVKELGASTVVIGRRGISKKEEFIFGSTSSSILHMAKECAAVWVVE